MEVIMDNNRTDSAEISWTDMSWNEFEDMDIRAANIPILEEDQYFSDPEFSTIISETEEAQQPIK